MAEVPVSASGFEDAVIIALGSNLAGCYPSRRALLEAAAVAVAQIAGRIAARSSWWRSAAWPDASQPEFLNGVLLGSPTLDPVVLMAALASIESDFGRTRGPVNAPRPLDLDLVAYGRLRLATPGLVVPHPRAHERRFVMGPLAEIAPSWTHPVSGKTAAHLATRAKVGADAAPVL